MGFAPFSISRLPRIEFGQGSLERLPDIAAGYGRRLLLVTGARSFLASANASRLFEALRQRARCGAVRSGERERTQTRYNEL